MRLVIADNGPVNYLILIERIDLLPRLFQKVVLPTAVQDELMDIDAPPEVRNWIAHPPEWLEIVAAPGAMGQVILGAGETAVIALAESLHADLLLIDERKGVKIARNKGFRVTGTLASSNMRRKLGWSTSWRRRSVSAARPLEAPMRCSEPC